MALELIYGLALFAFVGSITPGPNNIMVMASGVSFGFYPTIPHMIGIAFGFPVMVVFLGIGMSYMIDILPKINLALAIFSFIYVLWFGWKIVHSKAPSADIDNMQSHPLNVLQAAVFQWVNPKAWAMAISTIALYAPEKEFLNIVIVAIIFLPISFPCLCGWAMMGQKISHILNHPIHLKLFNFAMALALIFSMFPVLKDIILK